MKVLVPKNGTHIDFWCFFEYMYMKSRTKDIENIPKIPSEKRNEAKRFISLIDALYDNKNKVFITADGEPEELYTKGDSKFEFQRCISRLHEMRSKEYL